jgi:hypothetical protein
MAEDRKKTKTNRASKRTSLALPLQYISGFCCRCGLSTMQLRSAPSCGSFENDVSGESWTNFRSVSSLIAWFQHDKSSLYRKFGIGAADDQANGNEGACFRLVMIDLSTDYECLNNLCARQKRSRAEKFKFVCGIGSKKRARRRAKWGKF